jgi:exosome complex RNA-binding protein Rrp4
MLEDWEKQQITCGTAKDTKLIALAGGYLAQGHVIHVTNSVLVRIVVLRPHMSMDGFMCPFHACIMFCVLSGKAWVRFHDDKTEFAIGTNGMFRVGPGRMCNISNNGYEDVTLHLLQCPM